MAKQNRPLKDLGREHIKAQLKRSFPFLNNDYRKITEKEIDDEKVFKELFGEKEKFDRTRLAALYEFQK